MTALEEHLRELDCDDGCGSAVSGEGVDCDCRRGALLDEYHRHHDDAAKLLAIAGVVNGHRNNPLRWRATAAALVLDRIAEILGPPW